MIIDAETKKALLGIASWAVEQFPSSRSDELLEKNFPLNESVRTKAGCFVSVYVSDELRGCIGTFSEDHALHINVRNMAISAAYHDNRFKPLEHDEFGDAEYEISVLTPRKKISDPSEIEIGRHGIYMTGEMSRGTLLPQVAARHNWSPIEFLQQCSQHKAGLGPEGWRNADVYTYEAIVFKGRRAP